MSQTTVLMKLVAFVMLVSFILVVIATDESFKEFDVHREGFEDFQEQLGNNPLTEAERLKPAEEIELDVEGTVKKKWCLIEWWCPDLPTTGIVEGAIGFGAAILEFGRTVAAMFMLIFDTLFWFFSTVWVLVTLLALIATFTIPGIPFLVQMMLWSVNVSMWAGIFYIGFRAIRGGG